MNLRPYVPKLGTERLAEVWTLRKGLRTADCAVHTSPGGWDVIVRVDTVTVVAEPCKTEQCVRDSVENLQRDFIASGWHPHG